MTGRRLVVERRWKSDLLGSEETFHLRELDDGQELSGHVRIPFRGMPVDLTYRVETRSDWTTRSTRVLIPDAGVGVDVAVDESGSWSVDGLHRADLEGCIDIDLGWTPATNTLPICRLGPTAGSTFTVEAAWLRWPELALTAASQSYTKRENGWTYRQADFVADLETDAHGVVVDYGSPPIWYAV